MFLWRKRPKVILRFFVRSFFLLALGIVIIAEIVALSPSSLEEPKSAAVDPDTLIQEHPATLAPGIPENRIPEYAVDQFHYVSVQNGEKQWRIEADKANMYNPERLVHSRIVKAFLFDQGGDQFTLVTGKEAKYFLNKKDLEIYGQVKTVFPDGFEVNSEYLRYLPNERHIQIPTRYAVHGKSNEPNSQNFSFNSMGLDYIMGEGHITLLKDARVNLERPTSTKPGQAPGVPELTTIESDRCLIFRNKKLAQFTMYPSRPLKTRFVHITQPTLFSRSRRADLNYGDFSQVLQYLTAYEDVLIKEKGDDPKTLRYATGGKADFDTHRDVIVLTQFPQAYQNEDTVMGDIILVHRDTDMIEVEHSNAFSKGPE